MAQDDTTRREKQVPVLLTRDLMESFKGETGQEMLAADGHDPRHQCVDLRVRDGADRLVVAQPSLPGSELADQCGALQVRAELARAVEDLLWPQLGAAFGQP